MLALLDWIFSTDPFVPHGVCVLWRPDLVWTHVVSDGVIALSYFTIPAFLVTLVRQRTDLTFSWVFYAFGAFILLCGATHVVSIIAFWVPIYGLEALVKVGTAIASVITAVAIWPLLPKVLAMPSRSALEEANARLEQRVAERTGELETANAQLRILVHEVLHRTKNNLAVVASILRLNLRKLRDPLARTGFDQAIGRVEAMATVQEALYSGGRLGQLDVGGYLVRLVDSLGRADPRAERAEIAIDADPVVIGSDQSVPLALIAHEALTNAVKHAGADARPRVDVVLRRAADHLRLEVVNACGGGIAPGDGAEPGSGLQIARALAQQLDGSVGLEIADGRARFHLEFELRAPRPGEAGAGLPAPLRWAAAPG